MSIIERQIPRGLGASTLAMAADASARFIYDLATASLPMAIATVKAASDAVEAETRQHQCAAIAARKRSGRVRLQLVG